MTDERHETRDLLERAAPELGTGVKARAMAVMAAAGSTDASPRPRRWATALGAALVLLAVGFVPYSATDSQARMATALAAAQAAAASKAEVTTAHEEQSPMDKTLEPYRRRAAEFVQAKYPDDAEMLMAAGLLAEEARSGLTLLKKSVEMRGDPAAWAAYLRRLMEAGPRWSRPAQMGGDPADPQWSEHWRQMQEQSKLPDRVSPAQAASVLNAAHAWRQVEPNNAVPAVVEFRYLYAMHRDRDAFARWQEAGRLPRVEDHVFGISRAVTRLLVRMGMPEADAVTVSFTAIGFYTPYLSQLRDGARIAQVEGRWAQMGGRARDAIAWWDATVELGRHMQESGSSVLGCMVGMVLEGIGAAPAWKWYPDQATGVPGGPLMGGRIFYGPQHAFYAGQVGEAADAALRDSAVRLKVRNMMLGDRSLSRLGDPWIRAGALLGLAAMATGMLVVFLLALGAISLRQRRQADQATDLSLRSQVILAFVGLLPMAIGAATYWRRLDQIYSSATIAIGVFAGLALSLIAMLLLPLFAAFRSRRPGAGLGRAWRGNLRKVLPIAVAWCAVSALGLGLTGRHVRAQWIREITSPSYNEMARVKASLGPKWQHPPLPPDAWRAEAPPSAEKSGAVSRP